MSRFDVPNPEYVPQRRGPFHTSWVAKFGAVIDVGVLAFGIFLAATAVKRGDRSFPLTMENMIETVDSSDACRWTVTATLPNDSCDATVTVQAVRTITNQRYREFQLVDAPTLAPGAEATVTMSTRLGVGTGCPSVDEIGQGDLDYQPRQPTAVLGWVLTRWDRCHTLMRSWLGEAKYPRRRYRLPLTS